MKPIRRTLPRIFRLLALSALVSTGLVGTGLAQASDYSDITQLLKAGKPADALAKADQRLAENPRDPQLRFLRGVAQADAGKHSEAIVTFTKLTEEYPELPEPYNNLAVLYAGQNQLDKSRAALEMAIRTNPSYATAHENLGDIYAKLASQAYSKALQLDGGTANSVKPKLAMIRNLFSAEAGKTGARPAASVAAAPATTPVAPPSAPPVTSAKPAPVAAPAAPTTAAAPVASASAQATPPAAPAAPVAAASPAPAPVPAPAPTKADDNASATHDVTAAVQAWATAWSAKDMKGYLAAYGKDFTPPGKQSRAAWEKEREARIVGKSRISVKLSDMQISVNGNKATARFQQAYSADALNVSSRKTLDLVRQQGQWAIVRESTGG